MATLNKNLVAIVAIVTIAAVVLVALLKNDKTEVAIGKDAVKLSAGQTTANTGTIKQHTQGDQSGATVSGVNVDGKVIEQQTEGHNSPAIVSGTNPTSSQ